MHVSQIALAARIRELEQEADTLAALDPASPTLSTELRAVTEHLRGIAQRLRGLSPAARGATTARRPLA